MSADRDVCPDALSEAELARYARQLLLPGLGELGQRRLRDARVRVVGAGPVAGPAMLYLAQAGVGAILVDDPATVAPADASAWLYPAARGGTARAAAAVDALTDASRFVSAEVSIPAAPATAVLVCADSSEQCRAAAEAARRAGLPHVVAEADGSSGAVVTVPTGEPCYECAYRSGTGAPPTAAAAATLGPLAALELVLLLAGGEQGPRGRRIDLVGGQPLARGTTRLPGCACGVGATRTAPDRSAGEGP